MLGYNGQVTFRPSARGAGASAAWSGAAMSGESNPMMVAEGQGNVLYGFRGLHVTVIELTGETLTVEADRLLAHDANLQTSRRVPRLRAASAQAVRGAMTGQGLFTTQAVRPGSVARALARRHVRAAGHRRSTVGVDPQAYVGHVGALQHRLQGRASASATSSGAAPARRSSSR